jgi:hypothetical protein
VRRFIITAAKRTSEEEISKPVSKRTSTKVGPIGPWPNKKVLSTSDQKKEVAIRRDSFWDISNKDKVMH